MIYSRIWVSVYSLKYLKTVWKGLFTSTRCSRLVIAWVRRKVAQFLRILLTVMYFKGRNWIFQTVCCIGCLVVCKIVFCSEFPDIPDKAGRKTTRKRTQTTTKRYAFHANAKIMKIGTNKIHNHFKGYVGYLFFWSNWQKSY